MTRAPQENWRELRTAIERGQPVPAAAASWFLRAVDWSGRTGIPLEESLELERRHWRNEARQERDKILRAARLRHFSGQSEREASRAIRTLAARFQGGAGRCDLERGTVDPQSLRGMVAAAVATGARIPRDSQLRSILSTRDSTNIPPQEYPMINTGQRWAHVSRPSVL